MSRVGRRRIPLIQFVRGSDVPLRRCHGCDAFKQIAHFHPSSLRAGVYECRSCATSTRTAHARSESSRHKAAAAAIRKREGVAFTDQDFKAVLTAFGNRCFVTGAQPGTGRDALTLIKADCSLAMSPTNCAPCSVSIARRLAWQLPPEMLARWKAHAKATGTEAIGPEAAAAVPTTPEAATAVPTAPEAATAVPTAPDVADDVGNAPEAADAATNAPVATGAASPTAPQGAAPGAHGGSVAAADAALGHGLRLKGAEPLRRTSAGAKWPSSRSVGNHVALNWI